MSTTRATQRLVATTGFLLAVAVLLWLMAALSAWVTRGQLLHQAQRDLTSLYGQQPLWQWQLREPSDLVAGRVFGVADLASTKDGLQVVSRDGTPFELGLPLNGPVDMTHWPLLRLHLRSGAIGSLGLSYQVDEQSEACIAAEAARLAPEVEELSIDLRTAKWRTSTGETCEPPGVVSYMLRLQPRLPARATLQISDAALVAIQPTPLPARIGANTADIQLSESFSGDLRGTPIRPLDHGHDPAPLVRLPARSSAEQLLHLRDQIRRRWPGAVIAPFGEPLTATAINTMPRWLDWGVCALYLIWLLFLSLRQRPGVIRPWIEVAAIAAGPLWLIAGLRWGPQVSVPGVMAFFAALVYGGTAEWRRRPVSWSWLGRRPADWLWPLVPLPVAAVMMMLDGHGLIHLDPRHILAYFGWALLQQWAMLAIVMGRLRHTHLPAPAVILITAGLFGLLHTPNGSLMQLCLLAELWWAWCFMRSPRLIPIAVAHATCALLVESGLAGHFLRSLEVSARFFL